eukprot:jgi/Chrzof1/657/Cz01g24030.t1
MTSAVSLFRAASLMLHTDFLLDPEVSSCTATVLPTCGRDDFTTSIRRGYAASIKTHKYDTVPHTSHDNKDSSSRQLSPQPVQAASAAPPSPPPPPPAALLSPSAQDTPQMMMQALTVALSRKGHPSCGSPDQNTQPLHAVKSWVS